MPPKKRAQKRRYKREETPEYSSNDEEAFVVDDDDEEEVYEPPKKRSRKSKQTEQDDNDHQHKTEKRQARFRSHMPSSVRTRLDRALEQRLYLIERKKDDSGEQFAVLGSTGNVYNVHIGKLPTCTCPDFEKGEICKHILYVYVRVLRLPQTSPYIYQKALLSDEVEEIFKKAPFEASVYADASVRKAYAVMQGTNSDSTSTSSTHKQKPLDSEPCPVCYEDFVGKEQVLFCEQCGTNIHQDCWKRWKERSATCVYCRAPNMGKQEAVTAKVNAEGYVNLGKLQHDTPAYRDTSTYNDYEPRYSYGRYRRRYY